jgi:hypothetical protein
VVRHIFQACPVWIYTQSNITSINYFMVSMFGWPDPNTWEYCLS